MVGVLAGAGRAFPYGEPQLIEAAVIVAANRHVPGTVRTSWRGPEVNAGALASQDPLALVRFGLEAVLRTSLERYYASGADRRAKEYLGEQMAAFLGPGWRPPRQVLAAPPATPSPEQDTQASGQERALSDAEASLARGDSATRTVCCRAECGHSSARHYRGDGGRGHEGTGCKRRGCPCTELLVEPTLEPRPPRSVQNGG